MKKSEKIRKRYLDFLARTRKKTESISLNKRRAVIFIALFLVLLLIFSIDISPREYVARAGEYSPKTVFAPRTVQYIDRTRTKELRDAAADAIEDVFERSAEEVSPAKRIEEFFLVFDEVSVKDIGLEEKTVEAIGRTRTQLDEQQVVGLLEMDPESRAAMREATVYVAERVSKENITEETYEIAKADAIDLISIPMTDPLMLGISSGILRENILVNSWFNKDETERRKEAARNYIDDVLVTVLKGQVIVEKGEIITQDQLNLLNSLGYASGIIRWKNLWQNFLVILLFIIAMGMFIREFDLLYWNSPGYLVLVSAMLVGYAICAMILADIMRGSGHYLGYLMPVLLVTMLASILFTTRISMILLLGCATLTGVATGGDFTLSVFTIIGGIFPIFFITNFSTRQQLRTAAVYSTLWVGAAALAASGIEGFDENTVAIIAAGLINGVLCSIIAFGSLPFLETTFRITTNSWLLELASPNQKLLKELSLKAPGTYAHSIAVANLAEAAADEIGADAMLARVGAYYHDVGKLVRPQYFVENQPEGESLHTDLNPNLSAIIITAHVRDGIDMLEQNHLPPDLVDIVKQHHGTSLVRYFYDRAIDEADGEQVDPERFRYHFDKPKRRTSAILMLADSVEAAARAIHNPSEAQLSLTVERVIQAKLDDGQLDESLLTFKELATIKKVFARILIGGYHPRIVYPEPSAVEIRHGR